MNNRKLLQVYLGAFLFTVLACALFLAMAGATDDNIRLILRVTAHAAFLVLLVVFVARPLRQLVRTPLTLALLRNRALIGLTFAGIHTGHLMLVLYRASSVPDFQLSVAENALGAIVYALIFAMVITTFRGPARAIGPRAWRVLHKTGLYVTMVAFAQTQLPRSLDDLSGMNWWLASLLVVALVIRLTAFFARRRAD